MTVCLLESVSLKGDAMTANRTSPPADRSEKASPDGSATSTSLEDLGSRAADLSADLYASLEREQRKERFDRVVTRSNR